MDLTKTNVLWRGTSLGYAELPDGRQDGEVFLLRAAFADAVDNLRQLPGFEGQLNQRLSRNELARQRNELADIQRNTDPINCGESISLKDPCAKPTRVTRRIDGSVVEPQDWPLEISSRTTRHEDGSIVISLEEESLDLSDLIIEYHEECEIEPTSIGGVTSSGSSFVEDVRVSVARVTPPIEEDGGVSSFHSSCYETIDELGVPIFESRTGMHPCINETVEASAFTSSSFEGSSTVSGRSTVAITREFDTSNIECIEEADPLTVLLPKDLAARRAAVVEITNQDNMSVFGLLLDDRFVLTSADIVIRDKNQYSVRTSTSNLEARAFRINPDTNIALMVLRQRYKKIPSNYHLNLPDIGQRVFDLGMLDPKADVNEANLTAQGNVRGYRYSEKFGAEIIVDNFESEVALGSILINDKASILGLAHSFSAKPSATSDLFLPIESALKAVGMEICGKELNYKKPKVVRPRQPVTDAIRQPAPRAPAPPPVTKIK
jgi:hypothetical protein